MDIHQSYTVPVKSWYVSAKAKEQDEEELNKAIKLPGSKIIPLKSIRQPDGSTCGHTSLSMILQYYGIDKEVDDIRKLVPKKENDGGLCPESILAAAEELGLKAHKHYDLSFREIKSYLDDDTPLIIELQAWPETEIPDRDWKNEWKEGHYVVAIGYTSEHIIFADPSVSNKAFLTFEDLLPRWHDNDYGKKNKKLAIVIDRPESSEKSKDAKKNQKMVPLK